VSTIEVSSGNGPYEQVQALWGRGGVPGDAASQPFALASSQSTNAPAGMARSVLLIVLPSNLGTPQLDASKKAHRAYLAFPYGVLTIASYVKRFAAALGKVEILDLNLPSNDPPEVLLARDLAAMKPDIVGFSMSYDVSYPWLRALIAVVRDHNAETCIVAGGPAVTTAYEEILADCDLDACCYSEGEVALKELVEAEDMQAALTRDPWVKKDKRAAKPVYDDLDRIVGWSMSAPTA
jgi:anaerobic magnesium-protoporphyrin IX monomethyl ester cyclase